MLRRMYQLIGNKNIDEFLVKELFLQRLPANVRVILATSDKLSLDAQAVIADRIMEVSNAAINASTCQPSSSSDSDIKILRQELSELKESFKRFSMKTRSRSPSRSKKDNEDELNNSEYCWYHYNFKDRASKCKQPCKFISSENCNRPEQ